MTASKEASVDIAAWLRGLGLDDRYRGVFGGRMVVFMNEADMQARGIAEGDEVEIESLAEDGKRRVVGGFWVKPHSIPVGSIGAYYPETNPLLPLAYHDLRNGTRQSRSQSWFARSRRNSIQDEESSMSDAPDADRGLTDRVLKSYSSIEDPRLRSLVLALIRHLHAFVGETKLTDQEWEFAWNFMGRMAAVPDRNE